MEMNPSFNPDDWHKPGIDSRDILDPTLSSREALDALNKRNKVNRGNGSYLQQAF